MTQTETQRRIERYERHANRTRELAAAREAVIVAAKLVISGGDRDDDYSRMDVAVRALEQLEQAND